MHDSPSTVLDIASIPGYVFAVTTDASGNVYLAGSAVAGFPATPGSYQPNGVAPTQGFAPGYAFVAKLSPDLGTILYATLFGSAGADCDLTSDHGRLRQHPTPPAASRLPP